jgi:hypothetical protein
MGLYTEMTEIAYGEYLKLEGLLVLAHENERQNEQIIASIAGILGERPGHGHAEDAVHCGYTAQQLLRKSSITVLPPTD